MFKLGKLLCQKQPRLSEIENGKDKKQEQGIQYSSTFVQQNRDNKEGKLSSLQNDENALADKKESISVAAVEEVEIQPNDEQDEIVQENDMLNNAKRKEESGESIAKSKKYYSDDACNMDTCSKRHCASNACNRVIDKKRITDKEIDPSKLTDLINSSIKEAMQTIIKQCVMDKNGVTSPEKKLSYERSKIQPVDKSICRNRQDAPVIIKRDNDDEKYVSRKRYYPYDYSRKYEKQSSPVKTIKKRVKESYDGSTVSKYHPVKEKSWDKGTKKQSKLSRNMKTDNRRMTGNVNIYICSEANENAQRKEKQKEKSESCTESSSETTTERTNSCCVRTSSVSSSKLVNSIQKRRQKLQDQESENFFHVRENGAIGRNESGDVSYDNYENDSSMTLKEDDRLELSTLSSRSTEIGSILSCISSTRDGCCCQDTVSSYVEMHRKDLMRLKPKFISYDHETDQNLCTTRIFPKSSVHNEIGDSWMQRSVCVNKTQLRRRDSSNHSVGQRKNHSSDACRCCCKGKVNHAGKRRSSFDILHEKGSRRTWSRCSCIVEEDEVDQLLNVPVKEEMIKEKRTICRNNFDNITVDNLQNVDTVDQEKSIINAKETTLISENTSKNKNEASKGTSNVSRTPIFQKRFKDGLKSTPTEMPSIPKVSLVLKESRINTAIDKQRSTVLPKLQQRNKDIENERPEISLNKNTKETSEAKLQKEKNVSEAKSKNSFFGRSIKKALGLVRQDKMYQSKNTKDKMKNILAKSGQTINPSTALKSNQNNKSETEKISKIDVPITEGIQNTHSTSLSSKQEKQTLGATTIIKNENIPKTDPTKRPKSKLQAILASRRTVQPLKEDLKTSEHSVNTKQPENIKDMQKETEFVKNEDATGGFEKARTDNVVPCTKIQFEEESRQQDVTEADGYPCEKRSFESTVNQCCCCCLPVIDCTCDLKQTSTVCVIPKLVSEDICTSKFECRRVADNCECNEPVVCENFCKSGNVYRCDVPCIECNKPKEKCHCIPTYVDCYNSNYQRACKESIICVYCEHPRDKCVCRAPIRKCSYCGLSFDICKCREQVKIYNGRQIVTDRDDDRKICVTAWKPKPEVRRYFSRNFNDLRSDSIDECYCHKTHKKYGFNDLPYQRSSAFSDVMSELQQKMSDSVCCERCKKYPCCCGRGVNRNMEVDERKGRCYISTKQRQRSRSPEIDHIRTKSPTNHRFNPDRNAQRRTLLPLSRICYSCKASPCRCKKGRSTTKRPRAKCYYCKSSPCTCISAREVNKSRSCKCGDSQSRSKEKETVLCGKAFDDARKKNGEKVFRR